jgi:hypothetical protein
MQEESQPPPSAFPLIKFAPINSTISSVTSISAIHPLVTSPIHLPAHPPMYLAFSPMFPLVNLTILLPRKLDNPEDPATTFFHLLRFSTPPAKYHAKKLAPSLLGSGSVREGGSKGTMAHIPLLESSISNFVVQAFFGELHSSRRGLLRKPRVQAFLEGQNNGVKI